MNEIDTKPQNEQGSSFLTFKEIMFKYISNLPLFFFSLGLTLIVAWAYLRWATPVYSVTSSLSVKQESAANIKGGDKFGSIFDPIDKINMQDELELIKSKEFLIQTVENLGLNNVYIEHGKVRSSEIFSSKPFKVEVVKIADSSRTFSFDIQMTSSNSFLLDKESKPRSLYSSIEKNGSIFRLTSNGTATTEAQGRRFTYSWIPTRSAAVQIASNLNITQKNRSSSVLTLSLQTLNPEKGISILNQIM